MKINGEKLTDLFCLFSSVRIVGDWLLAQGERGGGDGKIFGD